MAVRQLTTRLHQLVELILRQADLWHTLTRLAWLFVPRVKIDFHFRLVIRVKRVRLVVHRTLLLNSNHRCLLLIQSILQFSEVLALIIRVLILWNGHGFSCGRIGTEGDLARITADILSTNPQFFLILPYPGRLNRLILLDGAVIIEAGNYRFVAQRLAIDVFGHHGHLNFLL